MANILDKATIVSLGVITPGHVSQSVDAFTGIEAYDITISGSLTVTGSVNFTPNVSISNDLYVGNDVTIGNDINIANAGYIAGQPILTSAGATGFVTSVNGVFPSPGGNVSVALAATLTGDSASLVISSSGDNTGSLSPGTLWVVSGDASPNNNGDAYIYTTSSITGEGQWLVVAPLDVASADARYILKYGDDSHTGSLYISGSGITVDISGNLIVNDGINNVPSIDSGFRKLYGSDGSDSINWRTRRLFNSSNVLKIDWGGSYLIDDSSIRSADWNNRTLLDLSVIPSIDWGNRQLVDPSLVTSAEWNNRILYDFLGNPSGDWGSRILYNSSNISKIDWENSFLHDNNFITSVDWNNRTSFDTSGINSVDWENRKLYDLGGNDVLIWDTNPQFYGTSSFATSASYALSSSYVVSSSFATSASFVTSASFATSASRAISSSFAISSSRAINAATSSLSLITSGSIIQGTTGSTDGVTSPQIFDASLHGIVRWQASFTGNRFLQVSNLTDGRSIKIYVRNLNASPRTIFIQASSTTSGYISVGCSVGGGAASIANVTLAASSGAATIWIANVGGNFVGSIS